MSSHSNTQQKNDQTNAGTYLSPALWGRFADAKTAEEFCKSWLDIQCRIISNVHCAAVFLLSDENNSFPAAALWPESFQLEQRFSPILSRIVKERRGVAMGPETNAEDPQAKLDFQIAYPVLVEGTLCAVATLEISSNATTELQAAMRQLQWGISWLQNLMARKQTADDKPDTSAEQRLSTVFDIIKSIVEQKDFQSAATVAVTELAAHLGCERVSIGIIKKNQARVSALSHSAGFAKQMNLIRSIESAMDECLDQQETLTYPPVSKEKNAILRSHNEHARRHEVTSILTVPFQDMNGERFGALTCERVDNTEFADDSITLCQGVAALIGPIFEEKRLNDRSLFHKAKDSTKKQLIKIFGHGHLSLKFTFCFLAAMIVYFSFATGVYKIPAKASLEGTVQRAVITPFEGYLYEAFFRAGDIVNSGDLLAAIDTRDLMLERLELASRLKQHVLEYRKSMSENKVAAYKITQEQINQTESQLALLEKKINRASIRAPFDGLIISGDLSQSIGTPVERGQVLFEIAPLHSYRIMLEVDERDIERVAVGKKGGLILNALPEKPFPFVVEKMTPVSVAKEGNNVFLVEAGLEEKSDRLRPGMQGYGKISIEERKLIWIWTHNFLDWIRLQLWVVIP